MAYWIVEDHGFCGQYYRCSNCRNVWIDICQDIPKGTCPKCGCFIDEDKTKYIDKPKKHKIETNVKQEKDLIEVVRCKSCKFSEWSDKNKQRYCKRKWVMYRVRERDYCSYGTRIKDNT